MKSSASFVSLLFYVFFSNIAGIIPRAFSQTSSSCPVPGQNCNTFNAISILPDTAYYNCDISKNLNAGLDKAGYILYHWIMPDQSTSSAANIVADQEGYYTLCYDTAAKDFSCPKTDKVYVTKFKGKFADAGPDVIACSGVKTEIGVISNRNNIKYSWSPPTFLVGDFNKSNPTIYLQNNSTVPTNITVVQVATDTITGCRDSDTAKVRVDPLPYVFIDTLNDVYCTGQKIHVDLVAYSSTKIALHTLFINALKYDFAEEKDTSWLIQGIKLPATYDGVDFVPEKAGDYTIVYKAYSGAGCMDSVYTVVKVNEPSKDPSGPCYVTAVSNPSDLSSTLCYPNPFAENLTVSFNRTDLMGTLRLSDMKGTLVADQKLEKASNTLNTTLLPPGIYVVEIITQNSVVTKQVIKLP